MRDINFETSPERQQYKREYYLKNKERILKYNKEWVEKNFEKVKARKAIHNRQRVYSLTEEQYQQMLLLQAGECAICTMKMDKPHVDHNHKTKVVRGLLCDKCNRGLGYFNDDPTALRTAADYIKKEG